MMLQPDNLVFSNISKHLAQKKKHLTLFLESKLRVVLHLNNVNKQKKERKKKAFQMIKTKLIRLSYKV